MVSKIFKLYLITLIVFSFIVNNKVQASTVYISYRDAGCDSEYVPGLKVDCTTPISVAISRGCPPGSNGSMCTPNTNWVSGTDNTLRISHTITFGTDKEEYLTDENIIPIFGSTNMTVVCPAKYTLTIPANVNISNLHAYFKVNTGGYILNEDKWTSGEMVNSFSLNNSGDYYFGFKDMTRSPLTYVNDCNNSQNLDLKVNYFGIDIATSSFKVLNSVSTTNILLK